MTELRVAGVAVMEGVTVTVMEVMEVWKGGRSDGGDGSVEGGSSIRGSQ